MTRTDRHQHCSNSISDPRSHHVVYGEMRWNAPLSEVHGDLLLDRLGMATATILADLGCGWGELLLRALERNPAATGVGIDRDPWALERAERAAHERGLSPRVRFEEADAAAWAGDADRVICIGASHAWGGAAAALHAVRNAVRPGGRLLFGDGCWEVAEPASAAAELFGDEIVPLHRLVDEAHRAGWRTVHLTTADQREWDDFESSWRAGRHAWLDRHPDDDRAADVKAELRSQLRDYVTKYRGQLGFAYLVLAA